jgi:16S rRNA (cytosine1402-N4)-methyltransferase
MHTSVLLEETIKELNLHEDDVVIDATLGYGGHSSEILKKIKKGYLYGFDQDIDAIKASDQRLKDISSNYKIIKSNFEFLTKEINKLGVNEVDKVLFDIGVSSPQLDEADRGFSFHQDSILDMRMDKDNPLTAKRVVNEYPYEKLAEIFNFYGEEKYASSIARGIVKYRTNKEIDTTLELVEIIKNNVPEKYKREKHPARKVFQALRIEVNNELEVFKTALEQAIIMLKLNGRVAVITFHSLEDKIAKDVFKKYTRIDEHLKNMPIIPDVYLPKYKVVATIEPSDKELELNNRSRSAKLRVIERIRK